MKILILLTTYIVSSIASAAWEKIGEFDVNISTGEFFNETLFIGGTLNSDLSLAALKTVETIDLMKDASKLLEEEDYSKENLSVYRRATAAAEVGKVELFTHMCEYFNIPPNDWQCHNIRMVTLATLGMVAKLTTTGYEVSVEGFGRFYLSTQAPRMGRNPKTGEEVMIPAKHRVMFRPSKLFSEMANNYHGNNMESGTTPEPNAKSDDLLNASGKVLMKSAGDTGFTATTNLKAPPPVVKVNTTVDPTKGTISPPKEGYQGSKFTIDVIPKEGYSFVGWTNSQCATGIFNTPITCEPLFVKMPQFKIAVIGEGTADVIVGADQKTKSVKSGDYVIVGTKLSFRAKAAIGWRLNQITPSECNMWQFQMPATDLTCTAEFVRQQ